MPHLQLNHALNQRVQHQSSESQNPHQGHAQDQNRDVVADRDQDPDAFQNGHVLGIIVDIVDHHIDEGQGLLIEEDLDQGVAVHLHGVVGGVLHLHVGDAPHTDVISEWFNITT